MKPTVLQNKVIKGTSNKPFNQYDAYKTMGNSIQKRIKGTCTQTSSVKVQSQQILSHFYTKKTGETTYSGLSSQYWMFFQ